MFPTKNVTFLKFLVVLIAFQDVAAGVASAIMADLIAAFPNYDPTTVMLIATMPGLLQIIPSIFYGKLANRFSKRGLLITGLVLFLIGGIAPFFLENLWLIVVFRGILGLGVGITLPLSIDIIVAFFDGRQRNFLIGFGTSTVACIGGIFFQVVGGMLSDAYSWQHAFLVYLFPILILVLLILYLPEPKRQQVPNAAIKDVLFKAPKTVYGFAFGQVIFSLLIFGYVTNIAIIIQSEGLGNATEAGWAISIFTLGTLLIGFLFGRIRSKWPNLTVPLGVALTAFGVLWCAFAANLTMIFIASFFGGIGLGIMLPGVLARVSELSDEKKGISYVGIAAAGQGLGGILSPFTFAFVLGLLGLDGGRNTLIVAAIGLFVLSIVWALITLRKPKTVGSFDSQTEIA